MARSFRAQSLFQQGAEDRGFDVFPILPRGLVQVVDVDAAELEGARGIFEQPAVEIFDVILDRVGEARLDIFCAHLEPKVGELVLEQAAVAFGATEKLAELVFRKKPDVLSEHAEEDAHQEQRGFFDLLRLLSRRLGLRSNPGPFFQVLADLGEARRDRPGNVRRTGARIDRLWIGPDCAEALPNRRVAQCLDRHTVGQAIGKEAVIAPVSTVVEIDFESTAHIEDDDERRPGRLRQALRVTACLAKSAAHEVVIFRAALRSGNVLQAGQRRKLANLLALLGFEDEATALVKIDEAGATGLGAAGHRRVDAVVVGGSGRLDAQGMGQLGKEHRVVGALVPRAVLPLRDEFFYGHAPPDPEQRYLAGQALKRKGPPP